MIELQSLNKSQLASFIQSDIYSKMPVLPISKHRAWSHIHNPRAHHDDTLLILAYEQETLLGYLGILPDDIYSKSGEIFHAGWLSCIWVSPQARGKGIAKKMVLEAFERYHHHILITNFTKEAGILYQKLGIFDDLPDLVGYRFYRKMCLGDILPLRYAKWAKLKKLFKAMDFVFNFFWLPFITKTQVDFTIEKAIPSEINFNDCNTFNVPTGFKRAKQEFEWIENYPWIKQVSEKSPESMKYHFSSEELQFESEFIKLTQHIDNVGFLKYNLRNGHLKIPYVLFSTLNAPLVSKSISTLITQKDASYITLFLPSEIIKNLRFRYLYKKPIKRYFKITKELAQKLQDTHQLAIFDGDGDAVFT
jgi:GNAT superfamily N-acetyltransferase